jgi:hypothetical protein
VSLLVKVCGKCGEEAKKANFLGDIATCDKCRKYLCDEHYLETGDGHFCPECFEEEKSG